MKKNDHVQFTGKLPKELKKTKAPIYGTIVKLIGKNKAEVKPRYKRFTVSILLTDLTKITDKVFTKPQKKSPKKIVAKAPIKITAAVVKAAAEVENKEPFRPSPETIAKVSKAESVEETKEILEEAKVIPMPLNEIPEAITKEMPKKEEGPYSWDIQDDKPKESFKTDSAEKLAVKSPVGKLIKEPSAYEQDMAQYLDDQESPRGGAVIWGVIAIIVAACIGAYILFF